MARPTKQGVDYFPLDVGFFSDVKIRKIARACGPNSASIIICLLCNIYKDEGYYILWDEDLPFVIADEVGVAEGSVKEVLLKAIQVGLFDNDLYEKYKILTSAGIQKRFFNITYQRKETGIIPEYLINHANNLVNCTNNSINPMDSTQSKVKVNRKKSKGKEKEEISPEGDKKKFSLPNGYPSNDVPVSLAECKAALFADIAWMETICMNNYIPPEKHRDKLDEFFRKLENEKIDYKSVKDAVQHYSNWLKNELNREQRYGQKVKPSNDDTERKRRIIEKFQSSSGSSEAGESTTINGPVW